MCECVFCGNDNDQRYGTLTHMAQTKVSVDVFAAFFITDFCHKCMNIYKKSLNTSGISCSLF